MYPDSRDEKVRRLEFSTSSLNLLNSLEQMGYRVVTSGSFVASQPNNSNKTNSRQANRFTQKDFIWTLHRVSKDYD